LRFGFERRVARGSAGSPCSGCFTIPTCTRSATMGTIPIRSVRSATFLRVVCELGVRSVLWITRASVRGRGIAPRIGPPGIPSPANGAGIPARAVCIAVRVGCVGPSRSSCPTARSAGVRSASRHSRRTAARRATRATLASRARSAVPNASARRTIGRRVSGDSSSARVGECERGEHRANPGPRERGASRNLHRRLSGTSRARFGKNPLRPLLSRRSSGSGGLRSWSARRPTAPCGRSHTRCRLPSPVRRQSRPPSTPRCTPWSPPVRTSWSR
jgi:hypothetical protein